MTAVFAKILEMSLAACFTVAVILLLRLLLRRAPRWIICAMWAVVAVQLILPISIEADFSLQPADSGQIIENWSSDPLYASDAVIDDPYIVYTTPVTGPEVPDAPDIYSFPTVGSTVMPILGNIWLAGIAAMLLYTALSALHLRRTLAEAIPGDGGIMLCDGIASPFIFGIFRPKIYLPSELHSPELDSVLAHECAHLARRDHIWKPLSYLLLTLHWFNPLVWLAYILFCRDLELACDERVIRDMDMPRRKAYSLALVECSMPRRSIAACPLAFGESSVKTRVKGILRYKRPALWLSITAALAAILLTGCFLTKPTDDTPEPTPDKSISSESVSSAPEEQQHKEDALASDIAELAGSVDRLNAALSELTDGTPFRIFLRLYDGNEVLGYGSSFRGHWLNLLPDSDDFPWRPEEPQGADAAMTWSYEIDKSSKLILEFGDGNDFWKLTALSNCDYIMFEDETGKYYFSGAKSCFYDRGQYAMGSTSIDAAGVLRVLYDTVDFDARYKDSGILIENRGQTPYEAAYEGISMLESLHLDVNPDSMYSYSFCESNVVEINESTEENNRWRVRYEVTFVPSNDFALWNSMAGNTTAYTGSHHHIPDGALMYTRWATLLLANGSWYIEITGTG